MLLLEDSDHSGVAGGGRGTGGDICFRALRRRQDN